ncbi:ABC transporter ATP-binding protein [uncultured Amnibacterium sp.]|uniref:ABC transporter ATP-binding protein n=1 Tax=uncultured Amnibacterium sp. TaxID=1631851 RepID=UPI0035CAF330
MSAGPVHRGLVDRGLAIETEGLGKRFRGRDAVADVALAVPVGSVFGFLGPNGSGKTTTIRMLLGLVNPTSGSAALLGSAMPDRAESVLPRVGALVEGPGFAGYLSGAANLARLDSADPVADPRTRRRRIGEALERVGLSAAAGKRVKAYSLGMKQRLGIANALLRPRDLLVLDEPTNGLDPQGTREVRTLVRELAGEGTTVFVSSHLLAEIEQMCTHAAVMRTGRLVAQGTLDELRGAAADDRLHLLTPDPAEAIATLAAVGLSATVSGPEVVAPLGGRPVEEVVPLLVTAGIRVRGVRIAEASLEDRFVALTGEGFDVEG